MIPTDTPEQAEAFMLLQDAFQIVLDLARQNVCNICDNAVEHARQMEAIDTLTDFAVNQFDDA